MSFHDGGQFHRAHLVSQPVNLRNCIFGKATTSIRREMLFSLKFLNIGRGLLAGQHDHIHMFRICWFWSRLMCPLIAASRTPDYSMLQYNFIFIFSSIPFITSGKILVLLRNCLLGITMPTGLSPHSHQLQ